MRALKCHLCVLLIAFTSVSAYAQVTRTTPVKGGVVNQPLLPSPLPQAAPNVVAPSEMQTRVFIYYGRLTSDAVASGTYQTRFALYDAGTGGNQIGSTLTFDGASGNPPAVQVINGIFTAQLDFGATAFSGADRFLEISIKKAGDAGYTTLTPRQKVISTPYGIRALDAATSADTASETQPLGAASTSQNLLANMQTAIGFIQNRTTQQPSSNFNISGDGTAGGTLSSDFVNATTQYNIGGTRVLSNTGTDNIFVGVSAGAANTTGTFNSFFGVSAGLSNTAGGANSFFGNGAGGLTTSGSYNSFFGKNAGQSNTVGIANSFFGSSAGGANTTAGDNSFFGNGAGGLTTSGSYNSFFGNSAGLSNTTGTSNTAIGNGADFSANNLDHATAIGAGAVASQSNTIALGRSNGSDRVQVFGLGTAGSVQLCRNANNEISGCSSSLRYKMNIAPFSVGLSLIQQLQPITFTWKDGGVWDLGFGAEDVARVNPLFITYNERGEVEGVKYDRLSALFVNAFKEQQQQIEQQKRDIEELKQVVCALKPDATACNPASVAARANR